MFLRIVAIATILVIATVAWSVLGATLVERTSESDTSQRMKLASLWGSEQKQTPPAFTSYTRESHYDAKQKKIVENDVSHDVEIDATHLNVGLTLDQRQKGLLWYSTYVVDFKGDYRIANTGTYPHVDVSVPFPAESAIYDDFTIALDGKPVALESGTGSAHADVPLAPGRTGIVTIAYRSHGIDSWSYGFGGDVTTSRNVDVVMRTNFSAIDYPTGTLAATSRRDIPGGVELHWTYGNLVSGYGIGMAFPERLQPGPLAQRITFWAPLSLAFYVFVLWVLATLRRIDIHPMNYLFIAASFFAFHLLFAYLVDRIDVWAAFAVCSIVSVFLTTSYLRLVVNWRFALRFSAPAQTFFLVLFSLALFNEGTSGLSITCGAIATLFLLMQMTGRVDWSERLAAASAKRPAVEKAAVAGS